jgi:hypothetical protein
VTGVRLEVGQAAEIEVPLQVSAVAEELTVAGDAGSVDVLGSVVGTVISAGEIESLPLNGRNFLELAFLTPGSAPAANFDPTKAQSVIVSSAGQAGRGGNITIDGMDDNDDVVGGPLQNIPQDAVQEFQVATNRFSAEFGRSAGSVINVVTRSGADVLRGSAAAFLRDQAWQALPATLDRDLVEDPPFDRQQLSFTLGGPLRRQKLFAFGALEVRNQDGGTEVGVRDTAARTIRRAFAPAPLDDLLGTIRVDWRASDADDVSGRYSMQREDDISASALDRAIGTASQRQKSRNRLHSVLGRMSSQEVERFAATRPAPWYDIAEEAFRFHDSHVRLFGHRNQIVGRVSRDEATRSPVIGHADLMNRLAVDTERSHATGHQGTCLDDAALGHDREPASRLDAALARQLR